MNTTAKKVQEQGLDSHWLECQEQLRHQLGDAFHRWFGAVQGTVEAVDSDTATLHLAFPSHFIREWVETHYGDMVRCAWQQIMKQGEVVLTVQQQAQRLEPERKALSKIVQFPLFPEETRPVSNRMARSALFSCVQGKDRRVLEDTLIAAVDGVEIRFTGRQFNQDDHDLLMQLVAMAKHKPLGNYVEVPARVILKGLGRKTGGDQHRQLRADMLRLLGATVSVRSIKSKMEYFGHLIDDAVQDTASRYWTYKFNPKLRMFYDPSTYTLVDWEGRKKLRGKDLARWLHLYIATHAAPFPVSVEYLHGKSGSQAKALKNFRGKLRLALGDLEANGDIEAWKIDVNDLVHVDRGKAISKSQGRYLLTGKTTKKWKHKA